MNNVLIAKVAVSGPFLCPLDYLCCDVREPDLLSGLSEQLAEPVFPVVGGRVWVPFRNKKVVGLVMSLTDTSDFELTKLKTISEVIDSSPLFSQQQLKFLNWASRYYHEPIGEVVLTALPKRLRMGEQAEVKGEVCWCLTDLGQSSTGETLPKNAVRQHALFDLLTQEKSSQKSVTSTFLSQQLENWRPALKKLIEKGWVQESKEQSASCLPESAYEPAPNHVLNDAQQTAVDRVVETLQSGNQFKAFLLQGITGSGKTEVYLGMIEATLAQGKQVLVLVPEIGLTPQMVARFEAQLQRQVVSLHSGLNDSERHCAWHLIRTGKVNVLLGTRSAIFTPFQNLGLCILDEEHDLSYKQQEGFRYSARDLMIQRAFQEKIPVVLGTATPSLESLHNVKEGRYQHLQLKQRAGKAKLPRLTLLDIRGEKIQEGVSRPLKTAMKMALEQGGQVLLFLNRRGFAPVLMCHDCGWQASCPSCDANMTLHSGKGHDYLQCHHCGEQNAQPNSCPSCLKNDFIKVGQGTERLQESIQADFPDYSVLRIDRDTTRQKGKMAELTGIAQRGEADILIGTQMLAKGHHFPNVTLVGILDVDQGLFSADYRAPERMAQLIMQVAGRAGRAEKTGEVFIQTHQPDHPLLTVLITQGYDAFAQQALIERKMANLPPHNHQILIRSEATNPQYVMDFLQSLKAGFVLNVQKMNPKNEQGSNNKALNIELWGPVSAPMLRRQGRYRFQLLLQSNQRKGLHQLMADMEPHIYKSPLARKVRWSIDVDPQDMM